MIELFAIEYFLLETQRVCSFQFKHHCCILFNNWVIPIVVKIYLVYIEGLPSFPSIFYSKN